MIGDEGKQCHAEQFHAEKQGGEMAAGHQHQRSQAGDQQQDVEFFGSAAVPGQVAITQGDHGHRSRQQQAAEEQAETVDLQ